MIAPDLVGTPKMQMAKTIADQMEWLRGLDRESAG
jgi:hypothetical protein